MLDFFHFWSGLSKLEEQGALRASDRVHLNHSFEFLVEDVANALNKTPEQARDLIASRCNRPMRPARKSARAA